MSATASATTSHTQYPPRIRRARTIGIAAAVFAALGFALMAWTTFDVGQTVSEVLSDPDFAALVESAGVNGTIADIGFGGLTPSQAVAGVLSLVVLFTGFGAVVSLFSLAAGIGIARSVGNPASRRRCFAFGMAGGIASILTLRFIDGILLIVASVMIRRQHIEDEGGAEAYYANGKRLGFMRFVEVACVLEVIMNVTLLLFVTRSEAFDGEWWINFVKLLMMAVTLWVIWNRKSHGCAIICSMVGAYLAINLVYYVALGRFDAVQFLANSIWPILLLLYFGFSKRARTVLSRPFTASSRAAELKEDEKLWNLKSPLFWRNLLLYFCIFSVVGHWMEWSVCWLIRWGIVPGTYDPNSGIWHDMLNPFFVYGIAFVFIGLLLFPIKNWLLDKLHGNVPVAVALSFVVNTLFCAAIELALGFACNTPPDPVTGKLPLWDYQDMAFNFMGQICLLNTSFFGVMATIMTWLVYPNLERAFSKIPKDVMNILTVVIVMFFVLVVCMYVINLDLASIASGMGIS